MTINLITAEQYAKILEIYKSNPKLTLQNKGYETPQDLTEDDKEKKKQIESILFKHIIGFREFTNFKLNKNNELQLRFQYKWSESFTGVGYILLTELLNGFTETN